MNEILLKKAEENHNSLSYKQTNKQFPSISCKFFLTIESFQSQKKSLKRNHIGQAISYLFHLKITNFLSRIGRKYPLRVPPPPCTYTRGSILPIKSHEPSKCEAFTVLFG